MNNEYLNYYQKRLMIYHYLVIILLSLLQISQFVYCKCCVLCFSTSLLDYKMFVQTDSRNMYFVITL